VRPRLCHAPKAPRTKLQTARISPQITLPIPPGQHLCLPFHSQVSFLSNPVYRPHWSLPGPAGQTKDGPTALITSRHCSIAASQHLTQPVRRRHRRLDTMANSAGSGGTSLAPTPTHPHHLSREPSKEDIEMAQNLSLLNHSQDSNQPRMEPAPQAQQSGAAPEGRSPEIYHSLEDTLAFQQSEQPEEAPTPATLASTSRTSAGGGANAPLTGQVCRCVIRFS
jgi:hypothetical protein